MGCKTVAEVVELQSTIAKSQYDKALTESRKLSDQTVKLAEQASKPIADQVKIAVETLSKPIAA
jgi:phasin family protein